MGTKIVLETCTITLFAMATAAFAHSFAEVMRHIQNMGSMEYCIHVDHDDLHC